MQLRDYQLSIFNKLIKFDKSILLCPRQIGKTQILIEFLNYYINNNKDKNILFVVSNSRNIKMLMERIYHQFGSIILNKHRTENFLYLINNNSCKILQFSKINLEKLNLFPPSIIIFDEFDINSNVDDFYIINFYIKYFNCKSIFVSSSSHIEQNRLQDSGINLDIIKLLDKNNDYFINITYNNIDIEIIKELSYKPYYLLHLNDLQYNRKQKLKNLKDSN